MLDRFTVRCIFERLWPFCCARCYTHRDRFNVETLQKENNHSPRIGDTQQLHLGVLRDIEQQERRKIQNVFYLQQQRELTKTLQKAEKQTKDQLLEAV
ncbi:cytochrome c oxidase assembly factor-like isoform X1 [Ptiloglossa arizonensis]|uniref:cytochrome c oxidase assembly factor-like isoform X1 n=1 Tax=Ptiloglossa arizonensis TaxID=3350558 RepID=UPI003FA08739